MNNVDLVKKIVEIDPAVTGDDFHARLAKRLDNALAQTGASLNDFSKGSFGDDNKVTLFQTSYTEAFDAALKEMETHMCLYDEYPIPSHRIGLIGAINKFIKRIALRIKLKTDVQVSQQAKFNLASLVATQIGTSQVEFIKTVLESHIEVSRNKIAEQDAVITDLKYQIEKLRERLDGR